MANRSYLYTYHPELKKKYRDIGEWRTDPPLSHLILVGADATPVKSAIWKTRKKIAIRGDATQTRPVFLAFLDWLVPQLPEPFPKQAAEAKQILLRDDRQGAGFHLELGEIYELMDLEPDEMADETIATADKAQALFLEVRRLVVTEGTKIKDSTDEQIRDLWVRWEEELGAYFSLVSYLSLGGSTNPNVGQVPVPPIPPLSPSMASPKAIDKHKPGSPLENPSLAELQQRIRKSNRIVREFNMPDTDLVGWLYLAILCRLTEEAKWLIWFGADVNALHERWSDVSCLQVAAENNAAELVRLLAEHGADVNYVGKKGVALMYAILSGNIPAYEYLKPLTNERDQKIAARHVAEARVSPRERARLREFNNACHRCQIPIVRKMIEEGIDVNNRCAVGGQPPLMLAASEKPSLLSSITGYPELVGLLLASGADPNLESYKGRTALMDVANAEICSLLLEAGLDPQAVDDEGQNTLMWLTDPEVCRLLLKAGAKADAVDQSGSGVLDHVAQWTNQRPLFLEPRSRIDAQYDRNLAEVFRLLIAAGAKLDPPTGNRKPALNLLAKLQVPQAREVLATAPVRAKDKRKPIS